MTFLLIKHFTLLKQCAKINLGKEAGKKMEEAHKKAAAVILKHRNEGHGNNYLDLHGLLLEEALTAVRER